MYSAEPDSQSVEALRRENEELRKQLEAMRPHAPSPREGWKPSKLTVSAMVLFAVVLLVVAFLAGYIPMQQRRAVVIAETNHEAAADPRVKVVTVARGDSKTGLQLPGSVQAINEAPILARTDGYMKSRFVELGDHVKAGQPLAELDSPEMEEMLRGARASLEQTRAALEQSTANLEQGKSELQLAKVSMERWSKLAKSGIVSQQDDDKYRLEYQARLASVAALEKALNVQRNSIAVAEANVARMENLKSYKVVKAPFDGIITLRNVDAGALVSAGNTLLFRIAQTEKLRMYVSVPQSWVSSVKAGQTATIRVTGLPGREFAGTVARTAQALDPTSRTLLVELSVPNREGLLMPGMSGSVTLSSPRKDAPLMVPADALVVRANGSEVAMVRQDGTVHLQKIVVGRDYGDRLEVLNGLNEGDVVIQNPGDLAREGVKVDTVAAAKGDKE